MLAVIPAAPRNPSHGRGTGTRIGVRGDPTFRGVETVRVVPNWDTARVQTACWDWCPLQFDRGTSCRAPTKKSSPGLAGLPSLTRGESSFFGQDINHTCSTKPAIDAGRMAARAFLTHVVSVFLAIEFSFNLRVTITWRSHR